MSIDDFCPNSLFPEPAPLDPNKDTIIKIIGVGGGGGNAVGYMYKKGVKDVQYVVCNTDNQALRNSPVPNKVLIGHTGLGAGDKPEVARAAAEESIDAINAIFDDDTKMVFITAGMGGGTGTGAAPVVARVARERGILTVGIVTIPFLFEGVKKITKALKGAEEMKKYVDSLLLINNERLIEIYHDLDFDSAFNKADDTLATAASSISELITTDDVRINVDFNDVDTTLRNGGSSIISCGYGEGENRMQEAIENALHSPLLKNGNIMGSKRLLFNLYYSRNAEHKFGMGEMVAFTDFVTSIEDVDVKYGVAYDDSLGNKVKVTILASGFDNDAFAVDVTKRPAAKTLTAEVTETENAQKVIEEQYGREKTKKLIDAKARTLYAVLRPEQFDDDNVIENLEKSPAYARTADQKAAITSATSVAPADNAQQSSQRGDSAGVISF